MTEQPAARMAADPVSEWRQGWPLVLACLIGLSVSGMHAYSLGVMIEPLERELGWSRAEIGSGMLVNSIMSVCLAPFVGLLIDRWGVRPIAIPGIVIYGLAIGMLSTVTGGVHNWWLLWLVVSVGSLMIKPSVWSVAVSKAFDQNRAFALAVMLCGTGVASFLWPIVTNALVQAASWRMAYITLGAGGLALALPFLLVFLPHGGSRGPTGTSGANSRSGLSFTAALKTRRFYQLALSALLAAGVIIGFNVHFMPIMAMMTDLSRGSIAMIMGVIGISSVVGRLCTGVLLDRFPGQIVGAICFLLPVGALSLLLVHDGSTVVTIAVAVILGLSVGSEVDVLAYLSGRHFGLRNYGAIFGTVVGLITLGGGLGPTLAGYVFDASGDYLAFIWLSIPCVLAASAMIAALGPYPTRFAGHNDDMPSAPSGTTGTAAQSEELQT